MLQPQQLLEVLKWRYATKRFDASKQISPALWSTLEEALVLTPSSYGLQPWQFLVVQTPEIRKQLRAKSWNQSQVEEASHFVVLTTLRGINEEHITKFMQRTATVRGLTLESLAGFQKAIMGDVIHGGRAAVAKEWLARQAYIALGNLMTSAALLGIDTCPMEGLDPVAYDQILGLDSTPYQTIVACALGYRHAEDKYAGLAKVRFDHADMIRYL